MPGLDQYTKLLLHMDGDVSSEIGGNDSYTKLLCHMDTVPLIDDSRSGRSITNNNVTVSTATKKFGAGSCSFNGSDAYLSMADSDDWDFGSGDFTIDFWVNFNNVTSWQVFYSARFNSMWFRIKNTGALNFYVNGTTIDFSSSALSWNTGQWYHLALVRSGNNWNIYRDGISVASDTDSSSVPDVTSVVLIGAYNHAAPESFLNGYLDEFRVSKGVARWTTGFTPPTTYYGGHGVFPSGGPKLDSSTKKFGSSSMYFDGTDDYLYVKDHSDWDLVNDAFTIDCWVKHINTTGTQSYVGQKQDDNNNWHFGHVSGTGLQFKFKAGGIDIVKIDASSGEITDSNWHHMAVTKSGTGYRLFVDGEIVGNGSDSSTYMLNDNLTVGAKGGDSGQLLYGYLDEFRISKGISRWTTTFSGSLPTEEYETDEYTKLLLHFPGDMSDSAHEITFNDDTTIDIAPTKWNGSFYFDGDGDYLTIPDSDDWNFGSDDFTIDFWVRFATIQNCGLFSQIDGTSVHTSRIDAGNIIFVVRDSGVQKAKYIAAHNFSEDTWYHLAYVRNGTSFDIYKNGVALSLTEEVAISTNSMPDMSEELEIGRNYFYSQWNYLDGFVDEFRISKGIGRWTSNFTPSSEPYSPNYISGEINFNGRVIVIRENDWSVIHNETYTSGSYIASGLGPDPVTAVFRKSDGESQGYGDITPS